jgi:hypothetical protein
MIALFLGGLSLAQSEEAPDFLAQARELARNCVTMAAIYPDLTATERQALVAVCATGSKDAVTYVWQGALEDRWARLHPSGQLRLQVVEEEATDGPLPDTTIRGMEPEIPNPLRIHPPPAPKPAPPSAPKPAPKPALNPEKSLAGWKIHRSPVVEETLQAMARQEGKWMVPYMKDYYKDFNWDASVQYAVLCAYNKVYYAVEDCNDQRNTIRLPEPFVLQNIYFEALFGKMMDLPEDPEYEATIQSFEPAIRQCAEILMGRMTDAIRIRGPHAVRWWIVAHAKPLQQLKLPEAELLQECRTVSVEYTPSANIDAPFEFHEMNYIYPEDGVPIIKQRLAP